MNIVTKLNLNQTAFFIHDNKPMSLPVGSIEVSAGTDLQGTPWQHQNIQYGFRSRPYPNRPENTSGNPITWIKLPEANVFASFEELCDSMKKSLDGEQ